MVLNAGTRLGPYEILSALGAGGMGQVYKARDTRLDRLVALKVIHPDVAASDEMRERFEREAKAISALDHPHICALYDVCRERPAGNNDHTEISFLVMQFLDGATLAESRSPVPLDTALEYAIEISSALAAAHRRGIIHRDLKPGNVMVTKTGTKLLDFGLAKLAEEEGVAGLGDVTRTSPLTMQGSILGTLHYMSPEQLEGRAADARSDLFSFGVVLYEMLTGRRPFGGESHAGVIAAIMSTAPLPLDVANASDMSRRVLDRVVRKCLAKDPAERWQTAADLSDELRWVREERLRGPGDARAGTVSAARSSRARERAWMSIAGVLLAAVAALAIWARPRDSPAADPVALTVDPPDGTALAQSPGLLAISPNGRWLVFATGTMDNLRFWKRSLGDTVINEIDRTSAWHPFWSPDSRFLAFTGSGRTEPPALRRMDFTDGRVVTLAPYALERGAWSSSGVILFTGEDNKLYRVNDTGAGKPELVVEFDPARGENAISWPIFLRDGQRFLFLGRGADRRQSALFLASLDAPGRRTHLLDVLSNVDYADGYLFYQKEGRLFAHPFDERNGTFTGDEVPVVESVLSNSSNGRAAFAVSSTGTLAYVDGANIVGARAIQRYDRHHNDLGRIGETGPFVDVDVSPDGTRVVVTEEVAQRRLLVLMDVARGGRSKLTPGAVDEQHPVWTADSSSIVFASNQQNKYGIYRRSVSGATSSDEVVYGPVSDPVTPTSLSADGRVLLFTRGIGSNRRIWALTSQAPGTARGEPRQVSPGTTMEEGSAVFSQDGKWIAYTRYERGLDTGQIYVKPYPSDGPGVLVSAKTGHNARWTKGQTEIVYRTTEGDVVAVPLAIVSGNIQPGTPTTLFNVPKSSRVNYGFAVDPGGENLAFVVSTSDAGERPAPITVIVNFTASLRKK